ncbi:MAG: VOC family protein [Nitriliruptorales bacterium]|nr:VOC family protein [Nitriliruptorales bacterium]
MTRFTEHDPGTFSWADLGTTDPADAQRFYGELFGWEMIDDPSEEHGTYTFCFIDDDPIVTLHQTGQEASAATTPRWTPYVTVEDVDQSAKTAAALGGTVVVEPIDMNDSGRTAMVQDPTGAVIALWKAREIIGAQRMSEPRTLTRFELLTPVTDGAAAFYQGLFGWTTRSRKKGRRPYALFMAGGRFRGGMMAPQPALEELSPAWLVSFEADDCDALARRAVGLGATLTVPPRDISGAGRAALLTDPQGAPFSIITSARS